MDDATLFELLRNYDPNQDIEYTNRDHIGGNYGIYLANLVYQKSKKFKDFREWLMKARLSALEREALEK